MDRDAGIIESGRRTVAWAALAVAAVGVLVATYAALVPGPQGLTGAAGPQGPEGPMGPTWSAEPEDRTIQMLAVEYKGTAGPGERLENGSKVSAYQWNPSSVVVNQGDRVTLRIYGVNGGTHPTTIPGVTGLTYAVTDEKGTIVEEGAGAFNVYRGHWTDVRFVAPTAGAYVISCGSHQPTMTGTLYVLG